MKSFLLKSIFVSVFAFIFALQTNAQLCGRYSTFISVAANDGKPIKNADIKLTAIEKDRTNGEKFVRGENPSEFSITFNEGHQVRGTYKITVSAQGYKTHEFETRFPHCERRNFILKLAKSDSDTANNLEEIREINFRAIDENKKAIAKVKTTVSWEKGEVLETISNDGGQTNFKVFNNKIIKVTFEKAGYETKEIEIDLSEYIFKYMDVELEKDSGGDSQTARFAGKVFDPLKALIPFADLEITDKNGKKYTSKSDAGGRFETDLPKGDYTIEISKTGFRKLKIINFKIEDAKAIELDFDLKVRGCDDCDGDILGQNNGKDRREMILDYQIIKRKNK